MLSKECGQLETVAAVIFTGVETGLQYRPLFVISYNQKHKVQSFGYCETSEETCAQIKIS